jgi:XRE family transcriptional regulator, regulator of sulfur utilization
MPRLGGRPRGSTSFDPISARAFGRAVLALRTAHRLAQEALALSAGVDRGFLGHLERGTRQPSLGVMLKIATALGCSPTTLMRAVEEHLTQAP